MSKKTENNHVLVSAPNQFPKHVELYKECDTFEEAFSLVVDLRSKKDGKYYWIGNIHFYKK